MKKLLISKRIIIIALVLLAVAGVARAQSSWVFPMVFRDATGISDTLWFIQNDNATIGLDEQFGEGQCEIDTSMFSVFFIIENTPSKILAIPFSVDFEEYVFATKWEFPITISWDKTLFEETIGGIPPIQDTKLLNRYSEGHDLYGNIVFDDPGWFILGIDSTGPQPPFDVNDEEAWDEFYGMGYASEFFPMEVTLSRNLLGVEENHPLSCGVYPNPGHDKLKVVAPIENAVIRIFNIQGQMVKASPFDFATEISTEALSSGIYVWEIWNGTQKEASGKWVKE